jgi:membrane fusion protein, multidrug efflux system
MQKLTIPTILVMLAAGGAGCSRERTAQAMRRDEAARPIAVEQVKQEQVRRVIEVVGTLAAADEVTVSSEATGRVIRILADLGDRVRSGQVVVELDREKLQYGLDQQRAALARSLAKYGTTESEESLPPIDETPDVKKAAAQLGESERAWKRAQELNKRSLLPRSQLEEAEARHVTDRAAYESSLQNAKDLRADIDASRAGVRLAERHLADASIRAPFDGYIQKRLVSPGQFVQMQTPVVSLVKVDPLKLIAEVPERMGPWVKIGQNVSVSVDAYPDRVIEGAISRISPAVNQQTRSFPFEAQVPNHDSLLKPGTFAHARLDSDHTDEVLTVPASAIQNRYGVNRVFAVKDGRLSTREVKLGDRLGDRVEVIEGIAAGQAVAISDVDVLADGMNVRPTSQADR